MKIQVASGKMVAPLSLKIEDINIEDIARSLANTCRFRGHTTQYYSVAEHCFHVSLDVPRGYALWALLHDAPEAYLFDIPSPLKPYVLFERESTRGKWCSYPYDYVETEIMDMIAARFCLKGSRVPKIVIEADRRALWWERDKFLRKPEIPWGEVAGPAPIGAGLNPQAAEMLFLERFRELMG